MNAEMARKLAHPFPPEKVKQKRGQGVAKSPEHRAKIAAAVKATKTAQSLSTAIPRFWKKVIQGETRPGWNCWMWMGSRDKDGYGYFSVCGKTVKAHRFAYERWIGPIPEGKVLDHLCRNPRCVNPTHLHPKTNRANILEGEGLAAQNARKTHCKRGHEFTPENTYLYRGSRHCRTCRSENFQAYEYRFGVMR